MLLCTPQTQSSLQKNVFYHPFTTAVNQSHLWCFWRFKLSCNQSCQLCVKRQTHSIVRGSL